MFRVVSCVSWAASLRSAVTLARSLQRGEAPASTEDIDVEKKKGRLAPALSSWGLVRSETGYCRFQPGKARSWWIVEFPETVNVFRILGGSSSAETADATARTRSGFLNLRGAGAERARAQSIDAGRLRPNLASPESNNLSEKSPLRFSLSLRALNPGRLSPAMHVDSGTDHRPDHRWIINQDIPLWSQNCPIHYRHS